MWSDEGVGPEEKSPSIVVENCSGEMTTSENAGVCVEPQVLGRRRERSMSVPCRSEATADVGAVVAKAKKASTYLWMLLHSQHCRLGVNRCTHAGCEEAKRMHLHLKTCPAGQDFPCPTRQQGCVQARKLLAHYRRCRTIRARQAGQPPGLKSHRPCLICSMVARQARTLLDAGVKSQQGPIAAHKKSNHSSKQPALTSFTVSSGMKPVMELPCFEASVTGTATTASFAVSSSISSSMAIGGSAKSSQWPMPPPAPRLPRAPQSPPESPTTPVSQAPDAAMKVGSSSFSHLSIRDPDEEAPTRLHQRQRSGSLDARSIGCDGRVVALYTSLPQLEESREQVPLVSVELENSPSNISFSDISSPTRRARSASCHVLSSPRPLSEARVEDGLAKAPSG